MDLIHAELLATGARIAPLTTLDEIAAFFHAAAAVGQAAPARATAIAQRLGGSLADAASMFASILPTLPSMPNVERLLSMLPPCESMSIGPNRDTCAVCEHGMLEPSEYYTTAPFALRQRFGQAGAPLQAQVLVLPRRAPPLVRNWWLALAARRASAIRGLHRCVLLRHHQELRVGDVAPGRL